MPKAYRIIDQEATYFITFTTIGWIDIFTRKACVKILLDSLKYCQKNKGLVINAFVIMSNHIHLVAYSNSSRYGLSDILRDFKRFTANELIKWITKSGKERRNKWMELVMSYHAKYNKNNTMYQVWQHNIHAVICTNSRFTWQKVDYIHHNPVVAGIVENPQDYLLSSARNYMEYDNCLLEVELLSPDIDYGYVLV